MKNKYDIVSSIAEIKDQLQNSFIKQSDRILRFYLFYTHELEAIRNQYSHQVQPYLACLDKLLFLRSSPLSGMSKTTACHKMHCT